MLGNFIFWRIITKNLKNVKENLKKLQKTEENLKKKIQIVEVFRKDFNKFWGRSVKSQAKVVCKIEGKFRRTLLKFWIKFHGNVENNLRNEGEKVV